MRVLLDESVPRQLLPKLPGHEVQTVVQVGWAGIQNGVLLRQALAAGFQALITMDRNLEHQQDISASSLGLVVLIARDNRVETVLPLATVSTSEAVNRALRAILAAIPSKRKSSKRTA